MRGEGLSVNVGDLVTYLIVMCNDESSISSDRIATHRKVLQATVTFSLKVRGVNFITLT